jgi:hypothetical protein
LLSLFSVTETSRWSEVAQQRPGWDERNRLIAGYIPSGAAVLDLGAGARTLAGYLPDCVYQPCDIIASDSSVLVCDFNAGKLPEISRRYDYAVASGLLEYLKDIPAFLARLPVMADNAIVSYSPYTRDHSKLWRAGEGWFNHYTQEQFEHILDGVPGRWRVLEPWWTQILYQLDFEPSLTRMPGSNSS